MKVKGYVAQDKYVELQDLTLKSLADDELLIRIVGTGLCHTDLGVLNQSIKTPAPIVLGHEGAGVVEKVGSSVKGFVPGDSVVISFNSCGGCQNCEKAIPSACENFYDYNFGLSLESSKSKIENNQGKVANLFGQSSLSTYCITNMRNTVKVDTDGVDLSILGPLACGVQTGAGTVLNKLIIGPRDTVVIFGCGTVGLSAVMASKLSGVKKIIAVDIHADRLDLALELGATDIINSKKGDVITQVQTLTDGGANYAIESTGVASVVLEAIRSVRTLGVIALLGAAGNLEFHIHDELVPMSKTLVGIVEGESNPQLFIPEMLALHKQGLFPFERLIKKYSFDELAVAIADMESGATIKPVLVID